METHGVRWGDKKKKGVGLKVEMVCSRDEKKRKMMEY